MSKLFDKYNNVCVSAGDTIHSVMSAIQINHFGICFVVEGRVVLGSISDGDIRRAILSGTDLSCPARKIMNKNFVYGNFKDQPKKILDKLSPALKLLPLLNDTGELVDFADYRKLRTIPIMEPSLLGNELEYVWDCISSGWISSQGKFVFQFEEMFGSWHGNLPAVSVCNGTAALHLALISLGVGPGDEVIVPNISFAASVNAILHAGARPVLCDVDPVSWNICARSLRNLITPRTKAVMAVHLYGAPANMHDLMKIADKYNVYVIEDCAEAIGSELYGKKVGTFGHAAAFSFFGNKTITTGEGGMVMFKDSVVAERARVLRDHGMSRSQKYWHDEVGYNYRMTNLQAAVGVAQLERIETILNKKSIVSSFYAENLSTIEGIERLPIEGEDLCNTHWLYTVELSPNVCRDTLIGDLALEGVEARPGFVAFSKMPIYQPFKRKPLMVSENLSNTLICLPSSPYLTREEQNYVVKKFAKCITNLV